MRGLRTSYFSLTKKLKEELNQKIEYLQQPKPRTIQQSLVLRLHCPANQRLEACSTHHCLRKRKWINKCKIKAVAVSLIIPFAEQFIDQSCSLPVVSELFHRDNLSLGYSKLLPTWLN